MVAPAPAAHVENQQAPQHGAGVRVRDVLPSDKTIPSEQHKAAFNTAIDKYLRDKASNVQLLTAEGYQTIIDTLLDFTAASRGPKEHRWKKNYSVITLADTTTLHYAKDLQDPNTPVSELPRLVHAGELFDVILKVHEETLHRKHNALYMGVSKVCANVSRDLTDLFCSLCPRCNTRVSFKPPAREGYRPILTPGMGIRLQIDMIDMQSCQDGHYKWILTAIDHGTKWGHAWAMTSKRVRPDTPLLVRQRAANAFTASTF